MRPKKILSDSVVARAAEQIHAKVPITTVAAGIGIAHGTLRANFARFEQYRDLAERPKRPPRQPRPATPIAAERTSNSAALQFLSRPLI